jgi:citrate lyase subunit beta/citryl-CoA lyase
MTKDIAAARTFLFVPGDRPDRFGKAAASGADAVILDLEDAVCPDRKQEAREHVREWLAQHHQAVVRVNAVDTPWHADDLDMVARYPVALSAVMVPKAEDPEQLKRVSRYLPPGPGMIPLIETAAGIMHATLICALASVVRPAFGNADLAAQLGIDHQAHDPLLYARSALVLAAAAAGCAAPVDGVTTSLADDSRLRADLEHAAGLGFTGKLCIHPRQVAAANQRLMPSDAEVQWARQIVSAARDGSVTVSGGQMIDRPIVLRAQRILDRASHTEP